MRASIGPLTFEKPLTVCPNPTAPSRALLHAVFAGGAAA
jgi:hypothetical protein